MNEGTTNFRAADRGRPLLWVCAVLPQKGDTNPDDRLARAMSMAASHGKIVGDEVVIHVHPEAAAELRFEVPGVRIVADKLRQRYDFGFLQ